MEHHVCKGSCGHVSSEPGMCSSEGCTNHGKSFEACGCGDDTHGKAGEGMNNEPAPMSPPPMGGPSEPAGM